MFVTARLKRAAELLIPHSVRARREAERLRERALAREERRLARVAQRRAALLESDPGLRSYTAAGAPLPVPFPVRARRRPHR